MEPSNEGWAAGLEPNFERFRTAVLCRGEPDHVPFADVTVYQGHKSRLIGRNIRGLTDEIEFAQRVSYDFVSVNIRKNPLTKELIACTM